MDPFKWSLQKPYGKTSCIGITWMVVEMDALKQQGGNFILMHSKIKKGRRKWRRHLQRVVGRIGSVSLHYESENTKQKDKPSELLRQSTTMLTLLLFAIK